MVTELELDGMTHLIASMSIRSFSLLLEKSERARNIFAAWCERYKIK